MNKQFLTDTELPFCKGCGHSLISENTDKALQKLGLNPLDVILVTDIGCHGIIDKCFVSHTFHGLHGRSVALASGVSAGLNNPDKKVIVFIGDGGATIGMQHIIDAAHNNFNLTVVIHNNLLYGMTGGQPSEFTPVGFKTPTLPDGAKQKGYDICEIVKAAGANYAARVLGIGDISDKLAEAFSRKGFSLIEVMEICPSYGIKSNPGMKLAQTVENAELPVKVYVDRNMSPFELEQNEISKSLINPESAIDANFKSDLNHAVRIMICGSAGEGVQLASELFAKAAISSGLKATKKGSYPVTVGIGFSSSDIIISNEEILYTGSPNPDILIITSQDGLEYAVNAIKNMDDGIIFIDSSLQLPETKAKVEVVNFREKITAKHSALYALFCYLKQTEVFPLEAMISIFNNSKLAEKIDVKRFLD